MSWNYRLVKHADGTYGIHSVYYDSAGYPTGMSMDPVSLGSFDYENEGKDDPKTAMLAELEMIRVGIEKDVFEEPSYWNDGDDT